MESLFELQGEKVTFAPQALAIKEFRVLWDRDKSKDKRRAFNELSYVYFISDWKSTYNNYPEDERGEAIAIDIFNDVNYKPDQEVIQAVHKYKRLHFTPSMGMLRDAEFALEKVRSYFREIDLTTLDDKGKPIYTAKDLMSNIKTCGDVFKGIKTLKEEVRKDELEGVKIRGGGKQGFFED